MVPSKNKCQLLLIHRCFFPPMFPPICQKHVSPPASQKWGGNYYFPPSLSEMRGKFQCFPPFFSSPPSDSSPSRAEPNFRMGGKYQNGGEAWGGNNINGGEQISQMGKISHYEGEIIIFLVSPPFRVDFSEFTPNLGFPPHLDGGEII